MFELGKPSVAEDFVLVGMGERGVNCGVPVPVLSCQSCLKTHWVIHRCDKKGCPDCWSGWGEEHTQIIGLNLMSSKTEWKNRRKRLVHIVVSPSPELVGKLSIKEMRIRAMAYLQQKSRMQISGVCVFHPFRPSAQYWADRREEDLKGDLKKWEWIREQGDKWREYVDYSPHFHFIVYVGWLDPPKEGEDYVYKTLMEKGKVRVMNQKRRMIFSTVAYVLSHTCDVSEGSYFHSYVYIGGCSARFGRAAEIAAMMAREKEDSREKAHCHLCGGGLWYARQNIQAFYRAWLDIQDIISFGGVQARSIVRERADIPPFIRIHVLEYLDFLSGVPPPPDLDKFIV